MSVTNPNITPGVVEATAPSASSKTGLNRFDSPWLNPKFMIGTAMILMIVLMSLLGPLVYDTRKARVASAKLNLPPMWMEKGESAHPLGTESNGRDMLAVILTGAPTFLAGGCHRCYGWHAGRRDPGIVSWLPRRMGGQCHSNPSGLGDHYSIACSADRNRRVRDRTLS